MAQNAVLAQPFDGEDGTGSGSGVRFLFYPISRSFCFSISRILTCLCLHLARSPIGSPVRIDPVDDAL
jgi:hypothetical protein